MARSTGHPRYAIRLCGTGHSSFVVPSPDCPNADAHTPQPEGYLDWHEWAETMGRTHVQHRCNGCGRLHIWKPKGAVDA